MTTRHFRTALALALVLSTASLSLSPLWAGIATKFSGRVLLEDGLTAHTGVVIVLSGATEEQTYRSKPTGDEGSFTIDGAPAGTYMLLAQTSQGVFLAAERFELHAGDNEPLILTLEINPQVAAGLGQTADGLPVWAEALIAGLIAVTAFVLFDDSSEDVEEAASDFNMGPAG